MMRKILLITGLTFAGLFAQAQSGSWKIKLNNKTWLASDKEDTAMNKKKIKSGDWKKPGSLEIIFSEKEKNTWIRSFLLYDENNVQLMEKDSTTYARIPLPVLRKIFYGKKEIRIYTILSPRDPTMAVRLRRVHLCTLKLP